jgi:hypothetical protein
MTDHHTLFVDLLGQVPNAIPMRVTHRLTDYARGRTVFYTNTGVFDVETFARDGHCTYTRRNEPLPLIAHLWWGDDTEIVESTLHAHDDIVWEGTPYGLITMNWETGSGCGECGRWLIAPSEEDAHRFFTAVCRWNSEIRGEVLVFSGGYWDKSEALYRAIQGATFENLILPGTLKAELKNDLSHFFGAQAAYERYGIPWKRGILLVGPPGNGKTHTIKALIQWLDRPCLYVKSLVARHATDHDTIKAVFDRARQAAPCLLILEDLDSLINDRNRSFFLNELDGFAANTGIVLIATTNHPDRLDPAIVDRPSRFDRKYHFPLPAPEERRHYIALWNRTVEPELRLSDAGLEQAVEATDGFTFAYLKELFLSSMMRWINAPQPGTMDAVVVAQSAALREQMRSVGGDEPPPLLPSDDETEID